MLHSNQTWGILYTPNPTLAKPDTPSSTGAKRAVAAAREVTMKLHERLRELRSERGLRLKDVAETAGISVPYLSDLERGRTNPSLETLQTLAGAYDITVQIGRAHV